MPILITGATGANGREIVRELSALKAPVRALVRDPARAADLAALGATLAVGSFEDPASIRAAAAGCDRALVLVPVDERMLEFARAAVAALRGAGVGHIVYFSAIGASPAGRSFFTRVHGQAEQIVKDSGADWTILRPNYFMQNLLSSAAAIKADGRFFNHLRDARTSQVDVRDTAALAARVLTDPAHRARTYEVTGPESLTSAQRAAVMSRVLGRPITSIDIPREAMQQALAGAGMPPWLAAAITDLDELAFNGSAGPVSDAVRAVTGRSGISFEQFIRDHAAAFAA